MVQCSFCGKSPKQVGNLIAGPSAYICNECIALCNNIIAEEGAVIYHGAYTVQESVTSPRLDDAIVLETRGRLMVGLGRRPTVAEIAAEVDLDEQRVTEILRQDAGGTSGVWSGRSDAEPVPAALRAIQRQLAEVVERLADLVHQAEHPDGP
jgi:hypothetical protein